MKQCDRTQRATVVVSLPWRLPAHGASVCCPDPAGQPDKVQHRLADLMPCQLRAPKAPLHLVSERIVGTSGPYGHGHAWHHDGVAGTVSTRTDPRRPRGALKVINLRLHFVQHTSGTAMRASWTRSCSWPLPAAVRGWTSMDVTASPDAFTDPWRRGGHGRLQRVGDVTTHNPRRTGDGACHE
jgi:hypothetical protein